VYSNRGVIITEPSRQKVSLTLLAILFFIGIIVISLQMWVIVLAVVVLLFLMNKMGKNSRSISSLFICLLISLSIYQLFNQYLVILDMPREVRIIFNRGLLIIIVAGVCVSHWLNGQRISFYFQMPKWNERIELPLHSMKLSYFMIIVIIVSSSTFLPFILQKQLPFSKSFFLFCFLFSILNATLEEVIWRGILLSNLERYVSVGYALFITSIGFGLLHLIIGIPFFISLCFSLGGLFYGIVVIKTNSIFPSIIFHFVINIGMVLSGYIL
jgi:uncharacterized protein